MIIRGVEIQEGQTQKMVLNIAKLPSRTSIDIAITVARARKPGPVLLLMGGLHGDEINGVEIVRRVIEKGINVPAAGTIICIPIINIYGFIHFSRFVPDGKDVNRSFPGNRNGSLASRVAYYLMKEIIPHIDYGIDFHTGGADRTNYPQIRCMMNDPKNRELASAFHAPFMLHSKYRPKSLRQAAAKLGKRIIVFEGGESSRFDEFAIRTGVIGVKRMLNHLGMASYAIKPARHRSLMVAHSTWLRARLSGLFQSMVKGGEEVQRNQIVGYITDPFGDFRQSIKSPVTGYVIGLNNNPLLHQGDAIMHLGIIESEH